jgi:DNA-binding LacI/PurR family transcriptional regulator
VRSIPQPDFRSAPTLKEVATAAGVSRATASRVFTRSPRVSEHARTAVERAARTLGYVPNRAARSLRTGKTGSVALVVPEPAGRLFGDPLFPRVFRGITEVLSGRDLHLLLLAPQSEDEEERMGSYLTAGHVDGALLVSLHGDDPLPARLTERRLPAVVGGRPPADASVSYVDVDNVGGAAAAVRHLAEQGRHRIVSVSGPPDMPAAQDRSEGYRRALEEAGIALDPGAEEAGGFTHEGGIAAMRALLERRPDLDAVFAASDLMAVGALHVLREAGRRVPDDVAVVGFDDFPFAASTVPPLSSVSQPVEEMGREMARLLIATMDDRSVPRRVILGTELVVRESSRPRRPT